MGSIWNMDLCYVLLFQSFFLFCIVKHNKPVADVVGLIDNLVS
jgi:hypothetical protein